MHNLFFILGWSIVMIVLVCKIFIVMGCNPETLKFWEFDCRGKVDTAIVRIAEPANKESQKDSSV